MTRSWIRERWRKLFVRESLQKELWPLFARGLRDYLLRKAEDDGTLVADDSDPVATLLVALRAHPNELAAAESHIRLLLADGYLELVDARRLCIRNMPEAQGLDDDADSDDGKPKRQPLTAAERMKRLRDRRRTSEERYAVSDETLRNGVTNRDENTPNAASRSVTPTSRGLSKNLPSSGSVDREKEEKEREESQTAARACVRNSRNGSTEQVRNVERNERNVTPRQPGQRPEAPKALLATNVSGVTFDPPPEVAEYASELGLNSNRFKATLTQYREKFKHKYASPAWHISTLCTFVETQASRTSSVVPAAGRADVTSRPPEPATRWKVQQESPATGAWLWGVDDLGRKFEIRDGALVQVPSAKATAGGEA